MRRRAAPARGWRSSGRAARIQGPPSVLRPACCNARSSCGRVAAQQIERLGALHHEPRGDLAAVIDVEAHVDAPKLGRIEADLEAPQPVMSARDDLDREAGNRDGIVGGAIDVKCHQRRDRKRRRGVSGEIERRRRRAGIELRRCGCGCGEFGAFGRRGAGCRRGVLSGLRLWLRLMWRGRLRFGGGIGWRCRVARCRRVARARGVCVMFGFDLAGRRIAIGGGRGLLFGRVAQARGFEHSRFLGVIARRRLFHGRRDRGIRTGLLFGGRCIRRYGLIDGIDGCLRNRFCWRGGLSLKADRGDRRGIDRRRDRRNVDRSRGGRHRRRRPGRA